MRAGDRGIEFARLWTDRRVDSPGQQQGLEVPRIVAAELDVQIVGPFREQLDQPGCRVLGEQRGGGDAQKSTAAASLAYLDDRSILQAQHLSCATGQTQAAGGEREARRRTDEELVAEFLTQLADVQ